MDENKNLYKTKVLRNKIKIIRKNKKAFKQVHSKKNKKIKATILTVKLEKLKLGMEIEVNNSDFDVLTLSLDGRDIAKGTLMHNGYKVAIKITRLLT